MIRAVLLNTGSEKPNKSRVFWWTHKGSNLGPLPCEGNALPLSYASGISGARSEAEMAPNMPRQSPRFTKCRPIVSSDQSGTRPRESRPLLAGAGGVRLQRPDAFGERAAALG